MNVIMLDIDGVIKPGGKKGRDCPEPHAMNHKAWPVEYVQRLQNIVDRVDNCVVVISSTWRKISPEHNTIDWWNREFANMGFFIEVFDVTKSADNGFRGREVMNWLMQAASIYNVENYIILDDDSDFYEYQPLYQVNGFEGIQDEDVDAIVSWFTEGKEFRKPPMGYYKETRRYDNNDFSLYEGYFK